MVAVFLVYQPAWQGGFLWDDDGHVTRPELRSWHGLWRIWFDIRATQQYYPLLHSAFWLQHQLWGDGTLGYHLVNIGLHCLAAVLVLLVLRRLKVPGAYLAAAIFALHPVQVESVAWITELKNTLSAVFYLGAMLSYLRFDERRGQAWYALALGLFALGLLSKTVTATLPGGLLVIFWWQRGRLSWKSDVLPLLPLFALGAAAGLLTAWVEHELIGAAGAEFAFTLRPALPDRRAGRMVLSGQAPVAQRPDFHLSALAGQPRRLVAVPLPSGGGLRCCWPCGLSGAGRGPRWRPPCFSSERFFRCWASSTYTLFGYSLVADHFQYLASLGVITLFAAGLALLLMRTDGWGRVLGQAGCVALVGVLAVLTWRQSRMYSDRETLYRTTIDRNPDCWLAHNNLGLALAGRGQFDEAIAQCEKALEIKPDYADAHNNLGLVLADGGQVDEAIAHYLKALEIKPDFAAVHYNLGLVMAGRGQVDEAIAHYRRPWKSSPTLRRPASTSAAALAGRGQVDEAIVTISRRPWKSTPTTPRATTTSVWPWPAAERSTRPSRITAGHWKSSPNSMEAHFNFAAALAGRGDVDEAMTHFQRALALASARNDRAQADIIRARIRLYQSAAPAGNPP